MGNYSREDIKRFKEICPSDMLLWDDKRLKKEMEAQNWPCGKSPPLKKSTSESIIIRETTTWVVVSAAIGLIKCRVCDSRAWMNRKKRLFPQTCISCLRITEDRNYRP